MPYKIFKAGNKFAVYKTDATGKKTGEPLGRHTSRSKANKQVAALNINVEEIEMVVPIKSDTENIEMEPDYELMDKSEVPWGAMTFADIEVANQAEELLERLEERTSQFYTLFWRIWNDVEIPVPEKVNAWQSLFAEFTSVFQAEISADETEMEELDSLAENLPCSIIHISESDKQDSDARQPLKMDVVVIEPGWGNPKDGHYYPADVLRRDAASVFEGAKMYATDHRPEEKSVRTEVGKIEKVIRFSETGAPVARVKIWNPDFAEDIRNRALMNELGSLEVSILAKGRARKGAVDGKEANIVEAIIPSRYTNVDFVTSAGAGGRAIELIENDSEEAVIMPNESEEILEPIVENTEDAETVLLHEGEPEQVEIVEPAVEIPVAEAVAEPVYLSETDVLAVLEKSKLPEISKNRLARIMYRSEAELSSMILSESDYIKTLIHSGEPFALGSTAPVSVVMSMEQLAEDHQKRIDAIIYS